MANLVQGVQRTKKRKMRSQWNENNRYLWQKRPTKTPDKTANVNQP